MKRIILISGVVLGLFFSQAVAKEVKVFILAGQSNMVGFGSLEKGRKEAGSEEIIEGGLGSLRNLVDKNQNLYGPDGTTPVVDRGGAWVVRDDVYLNSAPLVAKDRFGPEIGFGYTVGNSIDEPVLIIKTAWGGKDLAVDFRPPSSGDTPLKKDRELSAYYKKMMEIVKQRLDNIESDFPKLRGHKPRIAGFGWHQGWNDGCSGDMVAEYETNMANFIRDVRKEFGVEDMPFVIANSGMGNPTKGRRDDLCNIQLAMGDPRKHPEFKGTVASVETRGFFRPGDQSPRDVGYHWNANGETYFLIGEAMGKAMIELLGRAAPPKPAAPKPVAAKPVRKARTLATERREVLDNSLRSALAQLSESGGLKSVPIGISPTRARVWLKEAGADGNLTFQVVGGTQTASFKWGDLKAADHATLSLLLANLKADSKDAQAMAGVYMESIGKMDQADKYYGKAGEASRKKLEALFQ